MAATRRDVLKGAATVAGLSALSPLLGRAAWGAVDPQAATRRRLVVIDLGGGNDGLNTVVPRTGQNRAVYEQVRPTIKLDAASLRPLDRGGRDDGSLGLHPSLVTMHAMYRAGRVAIVQGVDYPDHSYSHFTSNDVWQAGDPTNAGNAGWIGRHLDRTGIAAEELRAVGVGGTLPHALRGRVNSGVQVNSFADTHFSEGTTPLGNARHAVYGRFGQHSGMEPTRQRYGQTCAGTVALDVATRGLTAATPGDLADSLLTARELLTADLGVEVVFVTTAGYDTHANQLSLHAARLTALDRALEAFWFGTVGGAAVVKGTTPIGPLAPAVADRTLVMTFSEFGRRIGDNGLGTDHGAAAPMLLVGPPAQAAGSGQRRVVPGLHGDHPDMGSTTLPADNLNLTTDVRSVYQAVVTKWIDDPTGPRPDAGDPVLALSGPSLDADGSLSGLFGAA